MTRSTFAVLCVTLLAALSSARADDDFYEGRLSSGRRAYAEKRLPDAALDLRIAAFGFLDRPTLLSETLVWLSLAESQNGRVDATRWALSRFVEVESRFRPYRQLAIDSAARKAFETLLLATLPRDTVAAVPSLAELIPPAASPKTAAPPKPAPKIVAPAPLPVPLPTPPPAPAVAVKPPVPAPAPAPVPAPARPKTQMSDAEIIAAAQRMLADNQNGEAMALLSQLVARTPTYRFAHLLLLHAATRHHEWRAAADQISFLEPFRDGEDVTMFYAAVALYHTGKLTDARRLLQRSLPKLTPSPYVDSYKRRILGE